jgi:ubiquitin-activating enzyme E1
MCTLHSFPHNIDHCLTFARSEFEGLLEKPPAEANAFLLDPVKCVSVYLSSGLYVPLIPQSSLMCIGSCSTK